jgi:segregation and condensation protein B
MISPSESPSLDDNALCASKPPDSSPLSLSRLRDAFAQMLGGGPSSDTSSVADVDSNHREQPQSPKQIPPASNACEISPRSVVEAMLFVGRPDNGSFAARELAASMRGVSPAEIDAVVAELNATYDNDDAPYRIVCTNSAYRLVLREELERMRDKFYGRVREAKLSPTAVEVLSIVAYNQPATSDEVNQIRGASSSAALSTLVRRKLVRLERSDEGKPQYWTTDRFLRHFGLDNLAALPRSEELEKI